MSMEINSMNSSVENHVCKIQKARFKDKMIHKGYFAVPIYMLIHKKRMDSQLKKRILMQDIVMRM